MSLVEKWKKESTNAREEESTYGYDCDDTVHLSAVATTLDACTDDLEAACTPRKPQPDWFDKWDAWWIRVTGGKYGGTVDIVSVVDVYQLHKDSDPWVDRDGWCITVDGYSFTNNSIFVDDIECVPVARDGFPAPVGWHVIGGEK